MILTPEQIRDKILEEGKTTTEALAFTIGNYSKVIEDTSKGALMVDSGRRACVGGMKAGSDFQRGDAVCGSLCCVSAGCETLSMVLVWCPIPAKVLTLSTLKTISCGCQKIRDMCAADPTSPFCK